MWVFFAGKLAGPGPKNANREPVAGNRGRAGIGFGASRTAGRLENNFEGEIDFKFWCHFSLFLHL